MLDFDRDGTYDKVYINDPDSDDDRYGWHTWSGGAWSASATEDGSDNHVEEGFPRWDGDRHHIGIFAIDSTILFIQLVFCLCFAPNSIFTTHVSVV